MQRLDWLRLIRSDNVGPRTFQQLINKFGGAGTALAELPALLANAKGARKIKLADRGDCERELEGLSRLGGKLIAFGEAGYPKLLRMIDSAPPLISVLGQSEILERQAIAIVGARNASAAGLAMTERLASDLSASDYIIVSGLARGVDRMAHAATLKTGTVAVLAGGFHHIYPAEHKELAARICDHGALVSEMPLGWQARGRDFPRRNRIVSGMGYATIVVEASKRSGSLITARFANEQGREVFAVPGSPLDPRAEGPNELLRQGASICLSAENVTELLEPMRDSGPRYAPMAEDNRSSSEEALDLWDETDLFGTIETPQSRGDYQLDEEASETIIGERPENKAGGETGNSSHETIESLLGPSPVTIDDLVRLSGKTVPEVQMALVDLELAGKLERHGSGLISRIG